MSTVVEQGNTFTIVSRLSDCQLYAIKTEGRRPACRRYLGQERSAETERNLQAYRNSTAGNRRPAERNRYPVDNLPEPVRLEEQILQAAGRRNCPVRHNLAAGHRLLKSSRHEGQYTTCRYIRGLTR